MSRIGAKIRSRGLDSWFSVVGGGVTHGKGKEREGKERRTYQDSSGYPKECYVQVPKEDLPTFRTPERRLSEEPHTKKKKKKKQILNEV